MMETNCPLYLGAKLASRKLKGPRAGDRQIRLPKLNRPSIDASAVNYSSTAMSRSVISAPDVYREPNSSAAADINCDTGIRFGHLLSQDLHAMQAEGLYFEFPAYDLTDAKASSLNAGMR